MSGETTADKMRFLRDVQANDLCWPRACAEKMPFVGHRTVAEIDNLRNAARNRTAKAYGYDPQA